MGGGRLHYGRSGTVGRRGPGEIYGSGLSDPVAVGSAGDAAQGGGQNFSLTDTNPATDHTDLPVATGAEIASKAPADLPEVPKVGAGVEAELKSSSEEDSGTQEGQLSQGAFFLPERQLQHHHPAGSGMGDDEKEGRRSRLARTSHQVRREAPQMPGNPRKMAKSATQAELHSVEEQSRRLTQEIPADTAPQQKAGEKVGLDLRQSHLLKR